MNLFRVLEISGSALLAERQRAEVVTSNLANAETHAHGQRRALQAHARGFRRAPDAASGFSRRRWRHSLTCMRKACASSASLPDGAPPVRRFEPGHPDADDDGYVSYPAINPVEEMVNLMGAARAYQLNASAVQSTKNMIQSSIDIIKS